MIVSSAAGAPLVPVGRRVRRHQGRAERIPRGAAARAVRYRRGSHRRLSRRGQDAPARRRPRSTSRMPDWYRPGAAIAARARRRARSSTRSRRSAAPSTCRRSTRLLRIAARHLAGARRQDAARDHGRHGGAGLARRQERRRRGVERGDARGERSRHHQARARRDRQRRQHPAQAWRRRGGRDRPRRRPRIQDESDRKAPMALGEAVETGAGRLPSRWVIHAATMELGGPTSAEVIRAPRAAPWQGRRAGRPLACAGRLRDRRRRLPGRPRPRVSRSRRCAPTSPPEAGSSGSCSPCSATRRAARSSRRSPKRIERQR